MMPLGAYPFAAKFAWVGDCFGVSWQLSLPAEPPTSLSIPAQAWFRW